MKLTVVLDGISGDEIDFLKEIMFLEVCVGGGGGSELYSIWK